MTVAQCASPFSELPPAGVITMHVVVQPSLTKTKTGKLDLVSSCGTLIIRYLSWSVSKKFNLMYIKFHVFLCIKVKILQLNISRLVLMLGTIEFLYEALLKTHRSCCKNLHLYYQLIRQYQSYFACNSLSLDETPSYFTPFCLPTTPICKFIFEF